MTGRTSYFCGACGYVYDPARGEPKAGIPSGAAFAELPEAWHCPVCENERAAFAPFRTASGRFRCLACGYVYDPARGEPGRAIPPGTAFEDLPDDYACPVCGAYARIGRNAFLPTE
jgi:rubredoxin